MLFILCMFLHLLYPSTKALYTTQFITSIKTSACFSTKLPFAENYKTKEYHAQHTSLGTILPIPKCLKSWSEMYRKFISIKIIILWYENYKMVSNVKYKSIVFKVMTGVYLQTSTLFFCNPERSPPGRACVVCYIGWCSVHYTFTCSETSWGWQPFAETYRSFILVIYCL
jgi:hypothetical protein